MVMPGLVIALPKDPFSALNECFLYRFFSTKVPKAHCEGGQGCVVLCDVFKNGNYLCLKTLCTWTVGYGSPTEDFKATPGAID